MNRENTIDRLIAAGGHPLQVALIYGAVYPLAPSQTRAAEWIDRHFARGDARIRPRDMKESVARLVASDVLKPADRGGGYRAAPQASVAMIRYAHASGLLAPLIQTLGRDPYVMDWPQRPAAALMFLRAAAIANDWSWLTLVRHSVDWSALLEPELLPALGHVPEARRADAVYQCTLRILDRLQDAESFLRVCEDLRRPDETIVANVALLRILQGRFDQLERWLAGLGAGVAVVRQAVRGLLHTLRGQDAEAMAAIAATLELARGTSRKRILHPPYSVFTLALLSLVRLNTPASRALFQEQIDNAVKLKIHNFAIEPVRIAARMREPPTPQITVAAGRQGDLSNLFAGLALCWSDSTGLQSNRPFLKELENLASRAEATGFLWIAAELQQILTVAGLRSGGVELHQPLGSTSLVDAVPRVEVWEHGLNALEQLASRVRNRKQKPAPAGRTVSRRLAWVVEDLGYDEVAVEAREQSLQTRGWGKGKPVSLRRLKDDADRIELLTEQDRAVVATITAGHHWSGRRDHQVPVRGLFLLAGHSAVLDSALRPLEVIAAEPELVVNDRGDGSISAELAPYPDGDEEYEVQYRRGDRQLTVLRLNESVRKLSGIIPPEGLILPGSARARLLQVVGELASEVRIHGGMSGENANVRSVDADPRPWVQLTPAGGGLALRVLVQPLPGSVMQFDPGAGGELVIADIDGETQQTRRELDAERRAAAELVEACPVLASSGLTGWRGELTDPDVCLELLDQLQRFGARCLWPEGETFRIVNRVSAASMKMVIKPGREWFAASGELAVDEARTLGLVQLLALLDERPRSRFVPLGDGQFLALGETFRQQLELLRGLGSEGGKALRLHPLTAPALEDLLADVEVDADPAWEEHLAKMRAAEAFNPTIPGTLQAELRPYQQDGIRWLARLAHWGVGACLADDMGLGKTLQALGLLLIRAPGGPALVVVPTSLVDNWQAEARRFAPPLNLQMYSGSAFERERLLAELGPFDVLVCTYGLLQNDIERFTDRRFHTVVLDEAQAIRNAATKRAQAVRALTADVRVAMTGTPVQNNLMDLHALFGFLNPGLLGSTNQFRAAYALPIERDQDAAARARLARLIAPFVLRRTKTEVLDDLPSRTEIVRSVTLGPEEAVFYEALRRQALAELEGLVEHPNEGTRQLRVLANLTRLRLACCHPQLVQDTGIRDSAKLTEFMTLLDELLQNRHKVLVFSQFVRHLKLIEAALVEAGVSYQYLDGQTPRAQRTERIQAFQSGQGDVFLISLKAGGTGLNLTAADYVIHMDPWWNPAAEDQASDRAHRIGQTRPVTIYRLVARGTIEEQIVALHHRKRDLAEQLLQDSDQAARLDADELLRLLREPALPATNDGV